MKTWGRFSRYYPAVCRSCCCGWRFSLVLCSPLSWWVSVKMAVSSIRSRQPRSGRMRGETLFPLSLWRRFRWSHCVITETEWISFTVTFYFDRSQRQWWGKRPPGSLQRYETVVYCTAAASLSLVICGRLPCCFCQYILFYGCHAQLALFYSAFFSKSQVAQSFKFPLH